MHKPIIIILSSFFILNLASLLLFINRAEAFSISGAVKDSNRNESTYKGKRRAEEEPRRESRYKSSREYEEKSYPQDSNLERSCLRIYAWAKSDYLNVKDHFKKNLKNSQNATIGGLGTVLLGAILENNTSGGWNTFSKGVMIAGGITSIAGTVSLIQVSNNEPMIPEPYGEEVCAPYWDKNTIGDPNAGKVTCKKNQSYGRSVYICNGVRELNRYDFNLVNSAANEYYYSESCY